jgi:hypothetical protein
MRNSMNSRLLPLFAAAAFAALAGCSAEGATSTPLAPVPTAGVMAPDTGLDNALNPGPIIGQSDVEGTTDSIGNARR